MGCRYLLTSLIIIVLNKNFNLLDIVYKLTTINYYINPDVSIDWYLNSIFILYVSLPLIYRLVEKYNIVVFWVLLSLSTLTFILKDDIHWKYDCLISRIPIFCLGITYYLHKVSLRRLSLFFIIISIPLYSLSIFLSLSLLSVPLILFISKISQKLNSKMTSFIGNYSLEIYCANLITYNTLLYCNEILLKVVAYIIIQIVTSIILIKINSLIASKILCKKKETYL